MAPSDPVTRADAAHLLRRVGFGGTESEITALTGRTREECVDELRKRLSSDIGFVARSIEVVVRGSCDRCHREAS